MVFNNLFLFDYDSSVEKNDCRWLSKRRHIVERLVKEIIADHTGVIFSDQIPAFTPAHINNFRIWSICQLWRVYFISHRFVNILNQLQNVCIYRIILLTLHLYHSQDKTWLHCFVYYTSDAILNKTVVFLFMLKLTLYSL